MIKINLLPVAERKKSHSFKLPSFSGGGPKALWVVAVMAIYVGMLLAMGMVQARKVNALDKKITVAKEEAERLRPQLERIQKLTKEREEVNKRLNVIATLDKDRYFRVQMLNDISKKLPANCWITSVKEQGPTGVSIEGVTFSNFIIADLMNNLQESDRFQIVALNIAEEGHIMEHSVIKFTLQSQVAPR